MNGITERIEQIQEILDHLDQGNWCAVIAPKNCGKSALAGQLNLALQIENPDWKVTRVTLKKAGTIEPVWSQVEAKMLGLDEPDKSYRFQTRIADALFHLLSTDDRTHCLILDNLDVIPDEPLRVFAAELKKFHDDPQYTGVRPRFHCVLLGATKLFLLTMETTAPLSNQVKIITLPALTPEQTVLTFTERLGTRLGEEAQKTLFAETAGHLYLINILVQRLRGSSAKPTVRVLFEAADYWSRKCVDLEYPDSCLEEVVRFIENQKRAFVVVQQLLDQDSNPPVPMGNADPALMCNALTLQDGVFIFRSQMFARALQFFMDDIRKADYNCLHGDWERACYYYNRVTPGQIQARRVVGFGISKRRITDLFLGLSKMLAQLSTQAETEQFIIKSGCYLFGANRARLWRLEVNAESAEVIANTENLKQPPALEIQNTVSTAARNQSSLILFNNSGVVQGIGAYPTRTKWALELQYNNGIEDWMRDNLKYVEPTLFVILDQAIRNERKLNSSGQSFRT
jgi:hypothetical protein